MLFNSIQFFLFFGAFVPLFFSVPRRLQAPLLLAASCYFYMAFKPVYILVLGSLVLLDYGAGLAIEGSTDARRAAALALSIAANLGLLGYFRYWRPGRIPLGLSFHTFQAMSYTIEVYRGTQKAERRLDRYALYVMFFPQLVAGPIERPGRLLPQFRLPHDFDGGRVLDGSKRMLWGLFKKAVIADQLAFFINAAYGDPSHHGGLSLLLATYLFTFQLYFDFSGYSDMAVGAAKVLGFELMENFDKPFLARSIREFWRRWHISLSSWFRDYVYIPLGGNRAGPWRRGLHAMLVFCACGLWHGSGLNFLLWGALSGLSYLASGALRPIREALKRAGVFGWPRLGAYAGVAATFNLFALSLILFRADTIRNAGLIFAKIVDVARWRMPAFAPATAHALAIALAALSLTWLVHALKARPNAERYAPQLRWAFYAGLAALTLSFGEFGSREFIYFQF